MTLIFNTLLILFLTLAIKANSDPTVIKVLASLNVCFDCASEVSARNFLLSFNKNIVFENHCNFSSTARNKTSDAVRSAR